MAAMRTRALRARLPSVLLLLAASLTFAAPASAQESTGNKLLSLEETRQCVCIEDAAAGLRTRVDMITPLESEYQRLDALVTQARDTIDTNDQAEVDSFRRLYERREDLRKQLNREKGPVLARLNGLVQRYNGQCANRNMLKINVDSVRANRQCPPDL